MEHEELWDTIYYQRGWIRELRARIGKAEQNIEDLRSELWQLKRKETKTMKINEMFPRQHATGADLNGKPVTLVIASMEPVQMRPGPRAPRETRFVLHFEGAKKGLILNRTLANQIATITGSKDTDDWIGHRVTLYPVPMKVAGQDRIAIRARAPQASNGTQPPDGLQDEEDQG